MEYYPGFGFERSDRCGISHVDPVPAEAFMVLGLEDGALEGVRGVVRYRSEFEGV